MPQRRLSGSLPEIAASIGPTSRGCRCSIRLAARLDRIADQVRMWRPRSVVSPYARSCLFPRGPRDLEEEPLARARLSWRDLIARAERDPGSEECPLRRPLRDSDHAVGPWLAPGSCLDEPGRMGHIRSHLTHRDHEFVSMRSLRVVEDHENETNRSLWLDRSKSAYPLIPLLAALGMK